MTDGLQHTKDISTFRKLPSARVGIPLFAAVVAAVLCVFIRYGYLESIGVVFPLSGGQAVGRFLFLLYVCGFASLWFVYFSSAWEIHYQLAVDSRKPTWRRHFEARSLRMLLRHTAMQWTNQRLSAPDGTEAPVLTAAERDEKEKLFRTKASTSLQNLGFMMTIAALEANQFGIRAAAGGPSGGTLDGWSKFLLSVGSICTVAAFVMFLVAADSLDTMFNCFIKQDDHERLLKHFYKGSLNRRYFGLVLLLFAATLLVAFFDPWLGTLSLGVIMIVGFSLWFPDIEANFELQRHALNLSRFGATVILGLPVLLWKLYA